MEAEELCVYRFRAMATCIEVQVPRLNLAAESLFQKVEEEFAASEQSLSRFRETSDLTQLNRQLGQFVAVSKRLYEGVSLAYRAYRITHGVFDPRVIRVLEHLGYCGAHLPSIDELEGREGSHMGPMWLTRQPRERVLILRDPIDLGGIGKGLTVRRASRLARQYSESFLINGGGDLFVSGPGPVDGRWSLGVENPFERHSLALTVEVDGGHALCTSSTKNRHWQNGDAKVHHLIHPFTQAPGGEGLTAVTVLGREPMWSEVFTKFLFLMGSQQIGRTARALNVAAWWIFSDGSLGLTQQAVPAMTWVNPNLAIREVV